MIGGSRDTFISTRNHFTCIQNSRLGLLEWKRNVLGNVQDKIESKQATLHCLNQGTITNVSKEQAFTLIKEIDKLRETNDVYWRQRSRVEWRVKEDRNTSYFHALSSQRGEMSLIMTLQDENGTMVTNAYDIRVPPRKPYST
ncbi:hypothetical protein LIER_42647 [Lithospermum erythrorhizon]|uniref:Uncharacterized protein n=1 Tax=Lithospermum erythrorhizon TaxID=34254 RepID=A0AAV3NTU1_LITER